MKCKQDALAEELVNDYTASVDANIRSNITVASTLLRGYAKLGKAEKMIDLFKREFVFDADDKENNLNYKALDVLTLNAVLECCFKQGMTDEANLVYNNYIQASESLTPQTASILVKGFCRIKQVDKAVQFWKQLNKLNIKVDDAFYNNLINGCSKNACIETALEVVTEALANNVKLNTSTLNTIMDSCVSSGRLDLGWDLLNTIKNNDVIPDNLTF